MKNLIIKSMIVWLVLFAPGIASAEDETSEDIKVVLLGTGTPVPNGTQYGPSILIEAGGRSYVFDCGRGCGMRLGTLYGARGYGRAETLLLTHMHSDHIVGIPELYMNGWQHSRNTPFRAFGPPGTRHLLTGIRSAYQVDVDIRTKNPMIQKRGTAGLELDIHEYDTDGVVIEENGVTITAFLVDHGHVKPAFGYRLDYRGRSVVVSGDTGPSENLVKHAAGADLVLHEVMSPGLIRALQGNLTPEEVKFVIDIHTTAQQAGAIFSRIKPRLVVYYHTINNEETTRDLLAATRETYAGPILIGADMMTLRVGKDYVGQEQGSPRAVSMVLAREPSGERHL